MIKLSPKEHPVWKKTHDKRGLVPREQINCHLCGRPLHIHDNHLTKNRRHNLKDVTYVLDIRMKCHHCDHMEKFGVPIPEEYWRKVKGYRGNSPDWTPYESEESLKEELSRIGIGKKGVKK